MKYKNSRKEIAKWLSPSAIFGYLYKEVIDMLLEPAEWPQHGDNFWYFHADGEIMSSKWWNINTDKEALKFGNCFKTKYEAEQARDKIKSLLRKK